MLGKQLNYSGGYMLDQEEAKQHAMGIGLTEDEAEDAINDFNSMCDDVKFCEDCGTQLKHGVNCEDSFDDYCNDCWKKDMEKIEKLKKQQL